VRQLAGVFIDTRANLQQELLSRIRRQRSQVERGHPRQAEPMTTGHQQRTAGWRQQWAHLHRVFRIVGENQRLLAGQHRAVELPQLAHVVGQLGLALEGADSGLKRLCRCQWGTARAAQLNQDLGVGELLGETLCYGIGQLGLADAAHPAYAADGRRPTVGDAELLHKLVELACSSNEVADRRAELMEGGR
jgi:hypothetical protein